MTTAQNDGRAGACNRTRLSGWRALWWLALGVMVLNDQVLKTAAVLPGWLTGKLSDFAGLIVAPVLLVMMTRARRPTGRGACFAVIVTLFVAIKISATAAHALETAVGWLGIHWRLWADATDLIALGVLPGAWRLAARAAGSPPRRRAAMPRLARLGDGLGVMAGALACLATSKSPSTPYRTAAFLANETHESMAVQIFRARAPLDCAAIAADPATALAGAPFDPEACWTLGEGALVPLARNWLRLDEGKVVGGPGGVAPPCDAVIVRVPGQVDTLLSWQSIGDADVEPYSTDPDFIAAFDPHGMYLERLRDRVYLAASPLITSQPLTTSLPDIVSCAAPDPERLDGGSP